MTLNNLVSCVTQTGTDGLTDILSWPETFQKRLHLRQFIPEKLGDNESRYSEMQEKSACFKRTFSSVGYQETA